MLPRLLVCDLDNTLYDWVGFFVPSFYAMVDEAVAILRCDREELLDDLKVVHQRYHDSEHPFALLETATVERLLSEQTLEERRLILDPAFKAFNSTRKQKLKLYPGVESTLTALQGSGVKLVAHSESRLYSVIFRLKFLDLTRFFDRIYCIERPASTLADTHRMRSFWSGFPSEKIHELSHRQRKPNPEVLTEMFADFSLAAKDCAYVGDSMAKDVYMAKNADCFAIWARYGTEHSKTDYEKLVRVSHWTTEEVTREANIRKVAENAKPDCIARNTFAEVVTCF